MVLAFLHHVDTASHKPFPNLTSFDLKKPTPKESSGCGCDLVIWISKDQRILSLFSFAFFRGSQNAQANATCWNLSILESFVFLAKLGGPIFSFLPSYHLSPLPIWCNYISVFCCFFFFSSLILVTFPWYSQENFATLHLVNGTNSSTLASPIWQSCPILGSAESI